MTPEIQRLLAEISEAKNTAGKLMREADENGGNMKIYTVIVFDNDGKVEDQFMFIDYQAAVTHCARYAEDNGNFFAYEIRCWIQSECDNMRLFESDKFGVKTINSHDL